MTAMMVMFIIALLGMTYLSLVSNNLMRADKDTKRTTAFYLAEAGIEYQIAQLADQPMQSITIDSTSILDSLRTGATGTITVTLDSGSTTNGSIVSTATFKGQTETIRIRVRSKNLGIWDNAIFAGVGEAGRGINGNVDIRGSVHILGEGDPYTDLNGNGTRDTAEPYVDNNHNGVFDTGDTFTDTDGNGIWSSAEPYVDENLNGQYDQPLTATDLATSMSGNANIGNNYNGIPSTWFPATGTTKIPRLVAQDINGETIETLESEVRVKHGKVNLSGSAIAGSSNITGNTTKEMLDGMYVTDGYGGTAGTTNIYSDNGTNQGYDLGDRVEFPSLFDPYTKNGISYSTYEAYLDANSLLVSDISVINSLTPSFSRTDGTNSISWNADSKVLELDGIIRFPGDLDISRKDTGAIVKFSGKGTLFSKGTVRVHGNVMPLQTFPTVDALGVIAKYDIELATGTGEAQLELMGAWFAQREIISAKQNQLAGTFVSNYFNLGTNVPSIYQVPALAKNLPPGMPGSDVLIVVTQKRSWRHL
ncbi:MAG: hypothetical protein ACYC27_17190 [Armatimonadota bacterium]